MILDLLLDRQPFATASAILWDACRSGLLVGYMSAIAPATIYYIGRKQRGPAAARQGLAAAMAVLRVCPVDATVLAAALAVPLDDFEDAIHYASGVAVGVEAIVTRDATGFRGVALPVYTTEAFVERFVAPFMSEK